MGRFKKEFLVGCLVLISVGLAVFLASILGGFRTFKGSERFFIFYQFAGGIEVGSPVRVSGVKVGRVDSIEFVSGEIAPLKLTLTIEKRALSAVRKDSRFYVNMAGIIGERYIEISPGSGQALEGGSKVRGIDPPRIDQLLSQGYGVFGKVQDFIDQNEVTISEFLQNLNRVLKEANEIFKGKENPSKLLKLIANLNLVAEDVHEFSLKLKTKESTKFFEDLTTLVNRTEKIDEKALREFLQKEGVRVRVF